MANAQGRGSAHDIGVVAAPGGDDLTYQERIGYAVQREEHAMRVENARNGVKKAEAHLKAAKDALAQAEREAKELG